MDDVDDDDDDTQPIPEAWRPMLRAVVASFAAGDYSLQRGVPGVEQPSDALASQIRDYIADYGDKLVELPEEAWETSRSQQVAPNRRDVFVDLWTAESGRSDMILEGWVDTSTGSPRFTIHLVYVP